MKQTFKAKLIDDGAFEVPIDVRKVYGEARPAVKMTFLGQTFRTRVAVYGGKYILGIWKGVREKLGLNDRGDARARRRAARGGSAEGARSGDEEERGRARRLGGDGLHPQA
jgi:hypothetical protein